MQIATNRASQCSKSTFKASKEAPINRNSLDSSHSVENTYKFQLQTLSREQRFFAISNQITEPEMNWRASRNVQTDERIEQFFWSSDMGRFLLPLIKH
jgi:hypothetical protein